ncbi:thioester reductase domain-containing protein [Archangium primigenium]|uniref:thioester reductase domain-containing protein n=1 Tax=[Archangium] primigenium TaxID=2792470 RepID=UPI00195874A2|nr:thioester reductase domain-containing protein [Archangium primigenium]
MLNIKDTVCKALNEVLAEEGRRLESTDEGTRLSSLGLDSLTMARVIVTLDYECDVSPFTQGGVDVTSVRTLGDLVQAYAGSSAADTVPPPPLEADATLAADIVPAPTPAEGTEILLTGATGFLGNHLLHELLEQTDSTITCLVRAHDDAAALGRVAKSMERRGLALGSRAARVRALAGDVSLPRFGLTEAAYAQLASRIGAVHHCAAWINFLFPYATLKPSNIVGTEEALRFACAVRAKPFHYISTLGVFCGPQHAALTVNESTPPGECGPLALGYEQTKWVAERLVLEARARGLPVTVYRTPFLTGHAQTGAWDATDLYRLMLRGCLELGAAPDWNHELAAVPVDSVSHGIIRLSRLEQARGEIFHMSHPAPITWREFVTHMGAKGQPLPLVPVSEWIERLHGALERREPNALAAVRPLFEPDATDGKTILERLAVDRMSILGCARTQALLAALGVRYPAFTPELLSRYTERASTDLLAA